MLPAPLALPPTAVLAQVNRSGDSVSTVGAGVVTLSCTYSAMASLTVGPLTPDQETLLQGTALTSVSLQESIGLQTDWHSAAYSLVCSGAGSLLAEGDTAYAAPDTGCVKGRPGGGPWSVGQMQAHACSCIFPAKLWQACACISSRSHSAP